MDRKNFYLHYGTITDILLEIENEVADEVLSLLTEIASDAVSSGWQKIMGSLLS